MTDSRVLTRWQRILRWMGWGWIDPWGVNHRWAELAQYNAERHRGVIHTPEMDARMAKEQAAFDHKKER